MSEYGWIGNLKYLIQNYIKIIIVDKLMLNQVDKYQKILKDFRTNRSSEIAASVLTSSL